MTLRYSMTIEDVSYDHLKEQLEKDCFNNGRNTQQLKKSYENSAYGIFVYDDEIIIGTGRVLSDGVCNAYLVDVWTYSPYRRRGIAKEMITRLSNQLKGQHIALFTDDQVAFYEHLGFKEEPIGMSKVQGQWLKK